MGQLLDWGELATELVTQTQPYVAVGIKGVFFTVGKKLRICPDQNI